MIYKLIDDSGEFLINIEGDEVKLLERLTEETE